MDPSSIVGLTATGLQATQYLLAKIGNVKDAPQEVRDIRSDLKATAIILQQLHERPPPDISDSAIMEMMRTTVRSCSVTCTEFKDSLDKWTENSTANDHMSKRNALKIGLFKMNRINSFRAQLNNYKGTLTLAVSVATLWCTASGAVPPIYELEDDVREELERAENEDSVLGKKIGNLSIADPQDGETQEDKDELLEEFRRQKASIEVLRELYLDVQKKAAGTRQRIDGVKADQKSKALAGIINAPEVAPLPTSQELRNITADNGSLSFAGMAWVVNFDLQTQGGGSATWQ